MKKKLIATMQTDMVLSYSEILDASGPTNGDAIAECIDTKFTWGDTQVVRVSIPAFLEACRPLTSNKYTKLLSLLKPFEQLGAMIELTD